MLLQINATHFHRDKSFRWSITSESVDRNREFRIDPHNGTLWLVRSLDRELQDTYRLKVRAEQVFRESRASIMYPILDDRISDLMDNEVRVSCLIRFLFVLYACDVVFHLHASFRLRRNRIFILFSINLQQRKKKKSIENTIFH